MVTIIKLVFRLIKSKVEFGIMIFISTLNMKLQYTKAFASTFLWQNKADDEIPENISMALFMVDTKRLF